MDEKDKELEQVHKKLESLHCQCDDYTRKIEDMEADLTHVQQEILALRIECEHKDKQVCPFYNTSLLKDCWFVQGKSNRKSLWYAARILT